MWQSLKSDFSEFIRSAGEEGGSASKLSSAMKKYLLNHQEIKTVA